MEELKVELLKIGKENGDTGDTEVQKQWISNFLDSVGTYLTPEGVLSFSPYDIRALYIMWLNKYLTTGSLQLCSELVVSHLELSMEPRQVAAPKPTGANVASIFERKA